MGAIPCSFLCKILPNGKIIVYNGNLCWNNNNTIYNIGGIKYGSWASNNTKSYTIKLDTIYNVIVVSCGIAYNSIRSVTTTTVFCAYNNQQVIKNNCVVPEGSSYSNWTNSTVRIRNIEINSIIVSVDANGVSIPDGNWIAW